MAEINLKKIEKIIKKMSKKELVAAIKAVRQAQGGRINVKS